MRAAGDQRCGTNCRRRRPDPPPARHALRRPRDVRDVRPPEPAMPSRTSARERMNTLAFGAAMATDRPTTGSISGIAFSPGRARLRYRLAATSSTPCSGSRGGSRSRTAMRRWGGGSMRVVSPAKTGLNRWPQAGRRASAAAETAAESPAKSSGGVPPGARRDVRGSLPRASRETGLRGSRHEAAGPTWYASRTGRNRRIGTDRCRRPTGETSFRRGGATRSTRLSPFGHTKRTPHSSASFVRACEEIGRLSQITAGTSKICRRESQQPADNTSSLPLSSV